MAGISVKVFNIFLAIFLFHISLYKAKFNFLAKCHPDVFDYSALSMDGSYSPVDDDPVMPGEYLTKH